MKAIVALGLGALAMYLLDPQQGRRRRALLRDQVTHAKRVVRERASGAARDLSNRAYGTAVEARKAVTPESAQQLGR